MTLDEWTRQVTEDFVEAGFTVVEMQGFPLVQMRREGTLAERVRVLKFRGRWACDKRLYAEGMLLVPIGPPGNPTRAEDGGRVTMRLTIKP